MTRHFAIDCVGWTAEGGNETSALPLCGWENWTQFFSSPRTYIGITYVRRMFCWGTCPGGYSFCMDLGRQPYVDSPKWFKSNRGEQRRKRGLAKRGKGENLWEGSRLTLDLLQSSAVHTETLPSSSAAIKDLFLRTEGKALCPVGTFRA